MADVRIYTKTFCGYSRRAKELLESKGVSFEEIDIARDPSRAPEAKEVSGGASSVPQVLIRGCHIGGCDELHALEESGELDSMLNGEDSRV